MNLLVLQIFVSFTNAFISEVIKPILALVTKENKSICENLKCEIGELKSEMSKLSIIDEFAKHARLTRRLNKVQDQLKSEVQNNMTSAVKSRFIVKHTMQGILAVLSIVLVYQYRAVPVIHLPVEWLKPIGELLSWPGKEPGTISFLSWVFISNIVAKVAAGYCL